MRLISILVSIYNNEKTLDQFFFAMEGQEVPPGVKVEFLICDDGSLDTSKQIVERHQTLLSKKFECRVVVNSDNRGISYSLSRLFELSSGDILVFIDADAIPLSNYWLVNITKKLMTEESIFIVQGNFWTQLQQGTFFSKQHERWRKSVYLKRFQEEDKTLAVVNTRNLAVKRSVIDDVRKHFGYFLNLKATSAGGDTDFGRNARALGYKVHLDEMVKVEHDDPAQLIYLMRQKIRHGYGDGKLGIKYSNNFYYSVYIPFVEYNVSLFFSVPITICFSIANFIGLYMYQKEEFTNTN